MYQGIDFLITTMKKVDLTLLLVFLIWMLFVIIY